VRALSHNVDVRGSFFVDASVDDAVRAIERGIWSVVRLPLLAAAGWRLPVSHGSLFRNPEDLGNVNRFYHSPMIGSTGSEL